MEQKTEASQAVDELLYEHARAIMQLREYGHSHDRAENVRAAEDAIRAALKAQPAPTEAAQGEDSARLADGYQRSTMVRDFHGPKITMRYDTEAQADAAHAIVVNMIDRARASAETGGVNDQPPYPDGDVVRACVCGSWPGGKCLKCPWIAAPQPQEQS